MLGTPIQGVIRCRAGLVGLSQKQSSIHFLYSKELSNEAVFNLQRGDIGSSYTPGYPLYCKTEKPCGTTTSTTYLTVQRRCDGRGEDEAEDEDDELFHVRQQRRFNEERCLKRKNEQPKQEKNLKDGKRAKEDEDVLDNIGGILVSRRI